MFEADRIAWTRPRLLVAGTKRIGRWLELLRANVDVRIHHVERLPDARAVTISGLHTPASFLRALARQAGGLDVRIHADGSLEVVRTRDAERLAGLVAGVGDAPWIRRETLEAICDLGRARGSDDIPPDVDRWCEALATTLVNEFALEKKTAQGVLAPRHQLVENIRLRDARPDSPDLARAQLAAAEWLLRIGQERAGQTLLIAVRPVLEAAAGQEPDPSWMGDPARLLYLRGDRQAARRALETADQAELGMSRIQAPREFEDRVLWPLLQLLIELDDEAAVHALARDLALRKMPVGRITPVFKGAALNHFEGERTTCRKALARLLVARHMGIDGVLPDGMELLDPAICTFALGDYESTASALRVASRREGLVVPWAIAFTDLLAREQSAPDPDARYWNWVFAPGHWPENSKSGLWSNLFADFYDRLEWRVCSTAYWARSHRTRRPEDLVRIHESCALAELSPRPGDPPDKREQVLQSAGRKFDRALALRQQLGESKESIAARKAWFERLAAAAMTLTGGTRRPCEAADHDRLRPCAGALHPRHPAPKSGLPERTSGNPQSKTRP